MLSHQRLSTFPWVWSYLELARHDTTLKGEERDRAVDELIELLAAVDTILQTRAAADVGYFANTCGRMVQADELQQIDAAFLAAYRWQHIHSGAQHPRFVKVLSGLITGGQNLRIQAALATFR